MKRHDANWSADVEQLATPSRARFHETETSRRSVEMDCAASTHREHPPMSTVMINRDYRADIGDQFCALFWMLSKKLTIGSRVTRPCCTRSANHP